MAMGPIMLQQGANLRVWNRHEDLQRQLTGLPTAVRHPRGSAIFYTSYIDL